MDHYPLDPPALPKPDERPNAAWWRQAADWKEPSWRTTCCGVQFAAMSRSAQEALIRHHLTSALHRA